MLTYRKTASRGFSHFQHASQPCITRLEDFISRLSSLCGTRVAIMCCMQRRGTQNVSVSDISLLSRPLKMLAISHKRSKKQETVPKRYANIYASSGDTHTPAQTPARTSPRPRAERSQAPGGSGGGSSRYQVESAWGSSSRVEKPLPR